MAIRSLLSRQSLLSETQHQIAEIERYDRIFSGSSGYGFFDWDLKKKTIHWDGHFWADLGYTSQDIKRLSKPKKFRAHLHEADREGIDESMRRFLKGVGDNRVSARIKKKSGGYIWAEVCFDACRSDADRIRYISGVAFDVSKLKQVQGQLSENEARYERMMKASSDGIWEWSAKHNGFTFSNRCWEQLGVVDRDNSKVDHLRVWRNRIHPDDVLRFDDCLRAHVEERAPFDIEYRVRTESNDWCWIHARGQMYYDERGLPLRMSGSHRDITELKKAQVDMLKAKEDAETANQAKSGFLSSMSHELRTPLNTILGYAQLFERDDNLSEQQMQNVREISHAGRHLLQLIGDLLDLAKIEAGQMALHTESVCIDLIVEESLALIREQAKKCNIKIEVLLREKGLNVSADGVRLSQVLINLLSNAVKYNHEGGGIKVVVTSTAEAYGLIEIHDTGRGIAVEHHKQIFEPFNRAGAEASNIEGSGVGLVICKQLIERMGGEIGLVSCEGQGSCFWVALPLASNRDDVEKHRRGFSSSFHTPACLNITEPKKVLYVEDSGPNQRLMRHVFSYFPLVSLQMAVNGFDGLYQARTQRPDFIILDIDLPGMSGNELASVLKQERVTRNVPLVALTANVMFDQVRRGYDAGFDRYLTKPVNIDSLVGLMNEFLVS